jgi:transposase-like protein
MTMTATDLITWIIGLLPWMLLGLALSAVLSMAKAHKRSVTAQFVVLRGRVSCPECSYLLDLDDKHCARCGLAVTEVKQRVTCQACKARNWEDDVHCRQCGEDMPKTEEAAQD